MRRSVILLEHRTGARVSYRPLPPLRQSLHDIIGIQAAAKHIAEFVGLTGLTFVVGVAKQKLNVGGHIDLKSSGPDVFVEIDSDTLSFSDAVAATLCHEICHKWLQVNGISCPVEIENEILTDITTVFLGLGKIMLNGCLCVNIHTETLPNATRTVREEKKSGYLDRDQLAFVYRLVCAMRNIPASEYLRDLSADAVHAIHSCDASFGHYYDLRFHKSETIRDSTNRFRREMVKMQGELSELDKYLNYIKKSCCAIVDGVLGDGHKKLQSLQQKSEEMTQLNEPDPALRFLRALDSKLELERMGGEIQTLAQQTDHYLGHAMKIGQHLSQNPNLFPCPTPEMFSVVTCHQDGTKLRLPENSGDLIATCPTCKYRFAYNTATIAFPEQPSQKKISRMNRIWNLMRGRHKS